MTVLLRLDHTQSDEAIGLSFHFAPDRPNSTCDQDVCVVENAMTRPVFRAFYQVNKQFYAVLNLSTPSRTDHWKA